MLTSNWSIGECALSGKARVIRQRLGLGPKRKSVAAHKGMDAQGMSTLCAKLERKQATKTKHK